MTTKDAIDTLIRHNEWRRGGGSPDSPVVIGAAIDTVCALRLMAVAYECGASACLIGQIAKLQMSGVDVVEHLDKFPVDDWLALRDKILNND